VQTDLVEKGANPSQIINLGSFYMRDILSKAMTGSMIAGAALLVAACGGGGESAANNTSANGLATDPMYDTGNDVTAIDGTMGNEMGMNGMTNDMGGNMTDTGGNMSGGNMTEGNTAGGNAQ
jgi:hypothetical protein